MIPCKDKFIYSFLTFLILGFSYIDLLLNEINKVLKWQPQSISFNMMMLKKIKKLFCYLAGKVQNFMGPQSGCKCNIVKKKTQHCCLFKAVCKEYVVVFLASGGVFDPGAVNTQMAVQGASLNMFGGGRF